jgi:hypothetical protein
MGKIMYKYILELKRNGKWNYAGSYEDIDVARRMRDGFMGPLKNGNSPSDARIITQMIANINEE